ncbi:hypothetical protein SDC9_207025 [bioreactor metagenome]|uniref:Uncharacterized protein n=1 Tax=bioreactor metagenome TaxID=1076179 RepID=A0A645JG32_9ZZZZ
MVALDADILANRIAVGEQVLGDIGAQSHHLTAGQIVGHREEGPFSRFEVKYFGIRREHPVDRGCRRQLPASQRGRVGIDRQDCADVLYIGHQAISEILAEFRSGLLSAVGEDGDHF